MTTCSTFANSIKKRVEEGKDLDTIAGELCGDVKFDRQKIIRVIKDFLGEEYLIEHAKILGYDVDKANLGKIPKAAKLRKIETATDSEPKPASSEVRTSPKNEPERTIENLVKTYGFENVQNALNELDYEKER